MNDLYQMPTLVRLESGKPQTPGVRRDKLTLEGTLGQNPANVLMIMVCLKQILKNALERLVNTQ